MPESVVNTFKPLGPAPIQDPFGSNINLANPMGSGIASGAINSLAIKQDPTTKSGWLYAASVNGGLWSSKYNGETDEFDPWQWQSSSNVYIGAQSISKIEITQKQKWLIAGRGKPSNAVGTSGNILDPLQVAEILVDGSLQWIANENGIQSNIFDAPITALESVDELIIIGTYNKGLQVSSLNNTGKLQTITPANLDIDPTTDYSTKFDIRSIAIGASGRIYAAVLGKGVYTINKQELVKNKASTWSLLKDTDKLSLNKDNLRLATNTDPATGEEIIFLGTSSNGRIDTINQTRFNDNSLNMIWKSENVAGLIGSAQADDTNGGNGNFSFASDPTNHNRVLAGGNSFRPLASQGGLVAVTFANAGDAKIERLFAQFNSDNSAPHADSRDIIFLKTKNGHKIIESDDGGIYQRENNLSGKWTGINQALNTAEGYASDWSNIGNLAITAMQDNSVAIGSYSKKPVWLNVYSGDGSIGRFDDGIRGSDNRSRGYYSSQMYDEGKGLSVSTYGANGRLEGIEYLNLNVTDEYNNILEFKDYDYQWALDKKIDYPFYQPVETSSYRAGDYVMAGKRNIYEQISPHWLGSPGEMNLIPLLPNTNESRLFTALAIGSENQIDINTAKNWDALFTAYLDAEGKTNLYGRQISESNEKLIELSLPEAVTITEDRHNLITGISFNPSNTIHIYTTISRWSMIYGDKFKSKNGDRVIVEKHPKTNADFDAASYLAYTLDNGNTWQEIKAGENNGIPKNANLQKVVYTPANLKLSSQIFVGGYGGVWVASIGADGKPGTFSGINFQGNASDTGLELWNTDLKYDPVDDVVIASMLGQGAWLLSRSDFESQQIQTPSPGFYITNSVMPQDMANYRNRKNRKNFPAFAISLERNDKNINKDVSVDLQLSPGWAKYIKIGSGKGDVDENTFRLSFPTGVSNLYINYEIRNESINIPDKTINMSLKNSINANVASGDGQIYLYATGDTISFYQEGLGVFYAQSEIAKNLSVLLPRASLEVGDSLYWYSVDDGDGTLGNVTPKDVFYLDFLNTPENPVLNKIAETDLSNNSNAFNPNQAYWAYQKPELAMQSEGIEIGELISINLGKEFANKGLKDPTQRFAFAIIDKSGKIKATPMASEINPAMDNALSFELDGKGKEIILAPGDGDLLIVSADHYGIDTPSVLMNLDVTRIGSYSSGYGIFRVDDLNGNFSNPTFENNEFKENIIEPGSIEYAKEALRRSLNSQTIPLDGITGLPIPGFGSSVRSTVELATGNAYGIYITPNKIIKSTDQLTDLSQILFSIKNANQNPQLQHVSMGTGYFAFEDMGLAGDRDFNDMLFAITPKNHSII